MNTKLFYWPLCITLLLVCAACEHAPVETVTPPPEEESPLSAEELRGIINNYYAKVRTLKASGTITINTPGEEIVRYPVVTLFQQPDRFYIRAYKPLTPILFQAITKEAKFHLFIPQENLIATGSNKALHSSTEYDTSINPEFIRNALFTQSIPPAFEVKMETAEPHFVMSVFSSQGGMTTLIRKLWLYAITLHCVKEVYYSKQGLQLYEVERDNFMSTATPGLPFAHTIRVNNTRTNVTVGLKLTKVLGNEWVDARAFDFFFPEGMTVEKIK